MNNGLWTVDTVDTISSYVIFKMLKLSIIRYRILSSTTCHIPSTHTERVDFRLKVSLTFDGKGGRWRVILNVYRLMLNEEGWKINTAECLRGRRGFRIFEINSKILSLVAKNIQASLILFHSFIRIFAR